MTVANLAELVLMVPVDQLDLLGQEDLEDQMEKMENQDRKVIVKKYFLNL